MRRREFLGVLGGAAIMPFTALAQERVRRIGVLMSYAETDLEGQSLFANFREQIAKLGWKEGQNIYFDFAWAGATVDGLEKGAQHLIALKPDAIISSGTPGTAALFQRTRIIPIVFAVVVDPVGSGFVASLPKPGGNVTGFMNLDPKMAGKWVELLKEIAPLTTRLVVPYNPKTEPYADVYLPHFKTAAKAFGLSFETAVVHSAAELETFLEKQSGKFNTGIIPMPGGFMVGNRALITSLVARHQIPAVYFTRPFVRDGGLLSYGSDYRDNWRRAALYVDRILKGDKPSDLPVQFPSKFELIINLRAAKELGLVVPLFLQQRADEVIE